MNGIIGKENRFEHLGSRFAVHDNAGFHRFRQVNGLFNGNEGANAHVGEPLNCLDNDLNVFALLVGGNKKRQVAELGQHAPEFGLKKDQHGQYEKGREKRAQQIPKDRQVEQKSDQEKRQQDHQKSDHHGHTPGAAEEAQGMVNPHREDQNLQHGTPPASLQDRPHYSIRSFRIASAMRMARSEE